MSNFFAYCLAFFLLFTSWAHAQSANAILTPTEQQWLRDHKNITLGFEANFPPYSFVNSQGQLEGLLVDTFNIIEEIINYQFAPTPPQDWNALYAAGQEGEVDVIASMVNLAKRRQWFNFTEPHTVKSLVLITQGEDQSINSAEDLQGKRVALVEDYHYVPRVLNEHPTITPIFTDSIFDALIAVSVGDADVAITSLGSGHHYRSKYLLTNLKYAAVYDNNITSNIGVTKDLPELVTIFNKAIQSIPESKMHELRKKWLPNNYEDLLVEIDLTEPEKAWIANNKDIRIGVDPEFAPFEYIENGQYQGMASDYIQILNRRLKLNMQVVEDLSWDEAVEAAKKSDIDLLPAVGITEERQEYFNFTKPYLTFYRVVITKEDYPPIFSLVDIANKKVAVQKNSSHHGYLVEKTFIKPITFDTLEESLFAVSSGQADAFIGNVAASTYWIKKLNLSNLKIAAPASLETQGLHFAVRKDWPELVSILQKGIDSISPTLKAEINNKWTSVDYEPTLDYSLLLKIVIPLACLLGLIVLWNTMLKLRVRERTTQLMHSAHFDALTHLPNRFLTLDRFTQRAQDLDIRSKKLALVSLDLDNFKKVVDSFGHLSGDKVLKEVAARLQIQLGSHELLGRMSGDQFLIGLGPFHDTADIGLIAQRFLRCFDDAFMVHDKPFLLSASAGIAIYPDDGDSAETLLQKADSATHHAKDQGLGTFSFYTKTLDQINSRHMQLEASMQSALENEEFYIHYQPKIHSLTQKIISFEALLRWENAELGNIPPVEFIPIAEKNGLIHSIGNFVLNKGLKDIAIWQQQFNQPFSIAINVSPIQFRSKSLVSSIEEALTKSHVANENLEIEITENTLMETSPEVDNTLQMIESLGVKLAMDDYGTGYASMSNLRKFKFDSLKIDQEFIADLNQNKSDQQMVSATIAMAHSLGLQVVAEGVENQKQSDFLIQHDCDILQGYFFSRPQSFDDITDLLKQHFSSSN